MIGLTRSWLRRMRRRPKGRHGECGFTLVEILVVITIIGLIMGLVGPRVLNYLGESKVKAAKIQIESFASALDLFYLVCRLLLEKKKRFVEKSKTEAGCLYYGFTFNGDVVCCREGYKDADAALAHLQNVGALLGEFGKITEILRLELHGPESELAKLRGPLADLKPQYF